ncbi:MAG: hypothetical protein AAF933_16200 [Pseudomonadota bacterium]
MRTKQLFDRLVQAEALGAECFEARTQERVASGEMERLRHARVVQRGEEYLGERESGG